MNIFNCRLDSTLVMSSTYAFVAYHWRLCFALPGPGQSGKERPCQAYLDLTLVFQHPFIILHDDINNDNNNP